MSRLNDEYVKQAEQVEFAALATAWQAAAALGLNVRMVDLLRASLAKEQPVVTAIGRAIVAGLVDGTIKLKTTKTGSVTITRRAA